MATGFYLPDGRDFSSVFTAGNASLNTELKVKNLFIDQSVILLKGVLWR